MSHKRAAWITTAKQVKRTTGRKLQAQRAVLFMREPLCRVCNANGTIRAAAIRDHITPLAEGGKDEDANIQPLCVECHDAKTATESARGRGVQISTVWQAETDLLVKFSVAGVTGGGGTPNGSRGAV